MLLPTPPPPRSPTKPPQRVQVSHGWRGELAIASSSCGLTLWRRESPLTPLQPSHAHAPMTSLAGAWLTSCPGRATPIRRQRPQLIVAKRPTRLCLADCCPEQPPPRPSPAHQQPSLHSCLLADIGATTTDDLLRFASITLRSPRSARSRLRFSDADTPRPDTCTQHHQPLNNTRPIHTHQPPTPPQLPPHTQARPVQQC